MNKSKQPVLGRGLDALMNPRNYPHDSSESQSYDDLKKDDGMQYDILVKIPVENISPNPFQPRVNFDPVTLEELQKSILENGLIQPVTVRRVENNRYELISGERRLKACIAIGYREIPAYIIKVDSEESMLAMALIENIQREKLNPVEIGMAYKRLMDECHLTQEQIADKVGKDRTTVANSIRLLKLPKEILDSLISEKITFGHARALINIPSEAMQLDALKKIHEDGLSVRKVEQLVKKFLIEAKSPKRSVSFSSKSNRAAASVNDVEDKLRKIFGTKVSCRQKNNGTGEIVIEFYSNDELERLFELFEIIDKTYH
jgi:ParB family transcriptional regulator, chromosome partitioning protein